MAEAVHHRTAYDVRYSHNPRYMAAQRARAKARYYEIKKYGRAALRGIEIDHRVPLAAGGSNRPSNWRLRSPAANRGDKTVFHDPGFHSLKR